MATAAAVAEKLAGHRAKKHGDNYLVCCPVHNDNSPSLSICDGDDGKLLVHCFAGCAARDVLAAIRKIGGNIETVEAAPKPAKGSSEYERQQHDKARWMWPQRRPITGTIVEKYLRGVRHITCPLPPTLGFLPPKKREHHPAMIAAFGICTEPKPGVIAAPSDVIAIHLTLLKPDGTGKAEVKPDKITVGSPSLVIDGDEDNTVGLPITIAPPNDLLGLAITEGIEDALTAHEATGLGAWAAGSASFMPKLAKIVPSYIEAITIYAHADRAGQTGAHTLAAELRKLRKLRKRSIEVTIEGLRDE